VYASAVNTAPSPSVTDDSNVSAFARKLSYRAEKRHPAGSETGPPSVTTFALKVSARTPAREHAAQARERHRTEVAEQSGAAHASTHACTRS
jgi:hypothetical protein